MKIAKNDCYAVDGVGVRRLIKAGDPVPPGLEVDADDVAVRNSSPTGAVSEPVNPPPAEPTDYGSQTVEWLQAEANTRELEIAGTGKDGNVLKADLVAALEAADAA